MLAHRKGARPIEYHEVIRDVFGFPVGFGFTGVSIRQVKPGNGAFFYNNLPLHLRFQRLQRDTMGFKPVKELLNGVN
jgi:hypothetical protein